jgi:protein ImuA
VWPPSALESLRAQVRQIEGQHRRATPSLPFGVGAVDARLPGGALALGALHEIAGGGNGAIDGAAAALFAAGIAARTRGKVLWCLTRLDLFAPALAQAGLNSDRVIYLEGGDEKTILACFEGLWCKRWRSSQLGAWKSPLITQRAPHSKSQERFCV